MGLQHLRPTGAILETTPAFHRELFTVIKNHVQANVYWKHISIVLFSYLKFHVIKCTKKCSILTIKVTVSQNWLQLPMFIKRKSISTFFFFLTNVLSCVKVTLHQQGNIFIYPSSGSNPSGTCPEHHFRAISQGTLTRTLKQASTPMISFP